MNSRLGRGLKALIPTDPEVQDNTTSISTIRVEKIHSNPYQPRHHFDEEKLRDLANSLTESGMIQPIVVTKRVDSEFELIAGERRLEAAKLAGFSEVPVIIRSVSPQEQLQFALVENIQRENLNPIEEAKAYHQLQDEFKLTQNEVAKMVGKDRSTVTNAIRLLKLPPEVQGLISTGKLSSGHARAILQLQPENQLAFADVVAEKCYSVRETEERVRIRLQRADKQNIIADKERGDISKQLTQIRKTLRDRFSVGVRIRQTGKGGSLSFVCKDEEELLGLIERLLKD